VPRALNQPGCLGDSDGELNSNEIGWLADGFDEAGSQPRLLLLANTVWRIPPPISLQNYWYKIKYKHYK
jgi:hypothetical protein